MIKQNINWRLDKVCISLDMARGHNCRQLRACMGKPGRIVRIAPRFKNMLIFFIEISEEL